MSGTPQDKITGQQVWAILSAAEGRCTHCGSLAAERRPSAADGGPAQWGDGGRRIGSLGHVVSRFQGGRNAPPNLVWSCLWCNTWPEERRPGATKHSGHHPRNTASVPATDPFAGIPERSTTRARRHRYSSCDELVDPAELDGWPGSWICDGCSDVDEDVIPEEAGYDETTWARSQAVNSCRPVTRNRDRRQGGTYDRHSPLTRCPEVHPDTRVSPDAPARPRRRRALTGQRPAATVMTHRACSISATFDVERASRTPILGFSR